MTGLFRRAVGRLTRPRPKGPGQTAAGSARLIPGSAATLPERPLVSVAVLWSDGASARQRVESVLAQSYPELEVLVVAADPDAPSVVEGLRHFDPRVRLVGHADQAGDALALVLAHARPGLIGFAEELWPVGRLATQLAGLRSAGGSGWVGDSLGQTLLPVALGQELGVDLDLGVGAVADFLTRLPGADDRALAALPPGARARILARRELRWDQPTAAVPGRVSLIVPVRSDLAGARDLIGRLDELPEAELVVVGLAGDKDAAELTAFAADRRVRVVRSAADSWALLADLGAQASTGEVLVFVGPGAVMTTAAVPALTDALSDPSVAVAQPLNQRLHLTVASAGAYFAPGQVVPVELLAGHPLPDAERLGDHRLPAAYSAVVALRRGDFWSLRGFDPAFGNSLAEVDLSLRAVRAGLGGVRLVNAARITARSRAKAGFGHDLAASAALLRQRWTNPPAGSADVLADAGFAVAGHDPRPLTGSAIEPQFVAAPRLVPTRSLDGPLPSFRWAIDIAATATWWGERWGDRYFAASLAAALRRLGQQVAIDHREVRDRETRALDDVVLVLRGVDQVRPQPGPINLLWVISHPDEVTAAEVSGYDRVFAAGRRWAEERSAEWGLPIRPLLQCTDAELFHPGRAEREGGQVLFVGNTRDGASRPVVDDALAAGVPLSLYGTGWEHTAAAGHRVAELVPNAELGRLYAEAGVVLSDHSAAMKAAGFPANRLFDAVACGARVLCDQVEDVEELFAGSVACYADSDEFARLLADPDAHWPDREQRLATAQRVRAEHSFDRRAEQLLAAAIEVYRQRDSGLQGR